MIPRIVLGSAVVALMSGTGAYAATLTINSITPQWTNVVADPAGGTISVDNDVPDIALRWGDPTTSTGSQSGYDFTAADTPIEDIAADTPFVLGDFNHLNFPIFDPVLSSVDLEVAIQIAGGPMVNSVFSIDHDETPNEGTCPAGSVSECDDIVTISDLLGGSETFKIDGRTFSFNVLGFSTDGGLTVTDRFLTAENAENPAKLYAQYSVTPIPLPAAGWLLLAGIGGLGALRRFRKT